MLKLIPLDRELTTDKQSTGTTRVQPDEPMTFVGVPYRNIGGQLLKKEQEGLKNSCITKAHSSITKLGTKSTLHSSQTAQQAEDCLS